jgi:hypothetical protein
MLPAAYTWSLAAIAAVTAVAMLWVFRRFSKQERLALVKRQIRAQLYAMRLFAAEPALIWRAQKQLLIWNARYLAVMLPPAAILVVPSILLFAQLDKSYGRRPVAPGETAIVTAIFSDAADLRSLEPTLEGRGFVVETTAVRLPDRHQACWRIRAVNAVAGGVPLRVSGGPVGSIEIAYPAALIRVFGYGMPWLVWFLAVGLLATLVVSQLGIPALRL